MVAQNLVELRNFKAIFNDNSKVLEFYKGLNGKTIKRFNSNCLKDNNNLTIVLNSKLKKLVDLILEIEDMGVDLSEVKNCLNNMKGFSSNNVIYSKVENLYRALLNQYGKYINFKKILFSIKDETNLSVKKNNLDFCIQFFMRELDNLRDNDIFINDDFSKFIGDIYSVGFELMMREFLINGESKLYNYFLPNFHDRDMISIFIELQIETLFSTNNVYGLNELSRVIDKKDGLFDKDVIIQIIICMYPKTILKVFNQKIMDYRDRLKSIYSSLKECQMKYQKSNICFISYFNNSFKLSKEYNTILDEYEKFVSSYKYLYSGSISDIKNEIKLMTLEMKHKLC